MAYVRKAMAYAGESPVNQAQCLNNLGLIYFLQIDFVRSRSCYIEAAALSNNLLYQLVSEIGLIRICEQISENADFYMRRNSAQRNIMRIQEEIDELNPHEKHLFQLAVPFDFSDIILQGISENPCFFRIFVQIKTSS